MAVRFMRQKIVDPKALCVKPQNKHNMDIIQETEKVLMCG